MSGQPEPEPMVKIYITNSVRTSRGALTGPAELPASEAGRLVAAKVAIFGSLPPRGMDGAPEGARREFR